MKNTTWFNLIRFLAAGCLLAASAAFGAERAGSVIFNTHVVGVVEAKVSRPDGTGAGAGIKAQLFLVGSGGSLTALVPATTFRTESAAAAYYVESVTVNVTGHASGEQVTLRMKAWNGTTYEGSSLRGESQDFTVILGGGLLPPASLTGLVGFALSGPTTTTVTIAAAAGLNGSINPTGTIIKNKGQSQSFIATPRAGYTVDKWNVSGVSVQTGGASFTLSNIQENRSVLVTFKQEGKATVKINASAGANGSISPAGTITRSKGQSQVFTATPKSGYQVDQWKLDGGTAQTGGNSYTLANIQAAHVLIVSFRPSTVTDTAAIVFSTRVIGMVDAKVSRPDGSGAGEGARAQLSLVGADGKLIPLRPVTTFRSTSPEAAYYVEEELVTVPGFTPGQEVTLRMRAWIGNSYDNAKLRGQSRDFAVILGGGLVPPTNLTGLEGFVLAAPTGDALPFIVEQPRNVSAHRGSMVSFSVKAAGSGPLSYQWQRNGRAIEGATGAILTLKNVKSDDEGNYGVKVSNGIGSTTSATARLTVKRKRVSDDFDDDGNPDILLIHLNRTLAFWFMDGVKVRAGLAPLKIEEGWEIVASGDFNNDGKTDILLRGRDRVLAFWFMDGANVTKGLISTRLPDGWQIVATGDFNNDDQTDLLLKGEGGALAFWIMDGTSVARVVEATFKLPDGWQILGAGDFNQDGETDILLRHSNRSLAFWLMEGTTIKNGLVPVRVPEGWQVIGLGDFNQDGQTDIMLRHDNRWVAFWFMDGVNISSGVVPFQEPEGWHVVGRR